MKALALRILCMALSLVAVASAQDVIPLYPGTAPGSTPANYPEKEYFSKDWNEDVVTNVTQPTLTVYKPSPGLKTNTGIVICPGGGFMALSWQIEGTEVAQYLAARGVTAFVLKYRIAHTDGDATAEFRPLFADQQKFNALVGPVIPLAIADGMAAMVWVRQNASKYGISPDRVGIIGFSAGGSIAAEVGFQYTASARPAFVAPIYSAGLLQDAPVPSDAPPMFLTAATDDTLGLAGQSIVLYQKWVAAKKSAELHMYAKGGHGFGMSTQNIPTDHWIDRFADWLQMEGFLSK